MVQKGWGKATIFIISLQIHGIKKKITCYFRSGNNLRKAQVIALPLTGKETKGQEVSYQNSQSK